MMLLMMLHPRIAEIVFEVIVANLTRWVSLAVHLISPREGLLQNINYTGMCRSEENGFQVV